MEGNGTNPKRVCFLVKIKNKRRNYIQVEIVPIARQFLSGKVDLDAQGSRNPVEGRLGWSREGGGLEGQVRCRADGRKSGLQEGSGGRQPTVSSVACS